MHKFITMGTLTAMGLRGPETSALAGVKPGQRRTLKSVPFPWPAEVRAAWISDRDARRQ